MMEDNDKEMLEALQGIHKIYVDMTGMEVRLDVHYWTFREFYLRGYTPDDLKMVLNMVLADNKRREYKRSLRLNKIVGDLERFDEDLAEAKARKRNLRKVMTPREKALEQLRPTVGEPPMPPGKAISISELFERVINENKNGINQEKHGGCG